MNTPLSNPSALVHPSIHPDERAAREQLAACYRVFALLAKFRGGAQPAAAAKPQNY